MFYLPARDVFRLHAGSGRGIPNSSAASRRKETTTMTNPAIITTATKGSETISFRFNYRAATCTVRGPGGTDHADLATGIALLQHLRQQGWDCR